MVEGHPEISSDYSLAGPYVRPKSKVTCHNDEILYRPWQLPSSEDIEV